jgi:phosphohistidine phosphatase SixA
MGTTLCLLRHGHAGGQGPDAMLKPEGILAVTALGRRLAREGWVPAAAFASPFVRALDTARLLLAEAASDLSPIPLGELAPDRDPAAALAALRAQGLPQGAVLVVAHMPLLARLALHLTGEALGFAPAMLAEIDLDGDGRSGRLLRVVEPGD